MRASIVLAPLFLAASTLAQGVEEGIAPASGPPAGCKSTVEGTFEIGTLENPSLKGKRETAQEVRYSSTTIAYRHANICRLLMERSPAH
jgi:hypothetical protein